jgi:predicted regulator of Ras-like GTPase activity (Roadblock/LC7/MglB family)
VTETTNAPTTGTGDLTWLVDDLVQRVADADHAIVLSTDGLLIASSADLSREDSEHLAAVASGLNSLARGAGRRFGNGEVRRTVIELVSGYLFVTSAGNGACLAVLCGEDTDVGLVAYEMEMLVVRVGQYITTPLRGAARRPQE